MAIDFKAVATRSNQRPEDASYEQGSVHKLGSRVTSKQANVVIDKLTNSIRKTLTDGKGTEQLRAYADTGERSYLSAEQSEALSNLVKACRESVGAESSAARRFWPRKVAAVIVADEDVRAAA